MKLVTTILAGALLIIGATTGGCSDDSDDGGAGAAGGAGGSGGGSCTPAAGIDCSTAAGVTECKRVTACEGTCPAVADCTCQNCTCQLNECNANASCAALIRCVEEKGCCPSTNPTCQGMAPDCTAADQCGPLVEAAATDGEGLQLALNVGTCTNDNACPTSCN